MTVRGAVTDPDGRRVELTDERWGHIVERHPEIDGRDDEVIRSWRHADICLAGIGVAVSSSEP